MADYTIWQWLILAIWGFLIPLICFMLPLPKGSNRFGPVPDSKNFGGAISSYLLNYFNFRGRASRSEYWYAMLFSILVQIPLLFVELWSDKSASLSPVWSLAMFFPTLSVTARRLHDINRRGWGMLLGYVYPAGAVVMLFWLCKRGYDEAIEPPMNEPADSAS